MRQKELLVILASAFIITIFWVIFNVYHSWVTSTIKDPLTYQIIPIEGKFDNDTIEQIRERMRVDGSYEIIPAEEEISPTPTPEVVVEEESGTESAEITPEISEEPTEE